tara:strand:+ start:23108 stop:23317 length:210 start_codon:yes stop_codon:yes gene_type:complete
MATNKANNPLFQSFKSNGTQYHTFDSKFHNWDGPAIKHKDGTSEYYVYGIKVSKQEWVDKKNGIESIDE